MRVKDMIEWLKTQDQEAIVSIWVKEDGKGHIETFNPDKHGKFIDPMNENYEKMLNLV